MDKDTNVKQISWSGEYKKMRRQWALRNNRTELIMLAVLLVGCVVMSMVSSTFLSVGNILNICSQQSTTALMAIGMTFGYHYRRHRSFGRYFAWFFQACWQL